MEVVFTFRSKRGRHFCATRERNAGSSQEKKGGPPWMMISPLFQEASQCVEPEISCLVCLTIAVVEDGL